MALRSPHGTGAEVSIAPRIEVCSAAKLPAPVPAPADAPRQADGRLLPGPATTELARKGARARHHRSRLVRSLGLVELAEDSAFRPYMLAATEFQRHHQAELAKLAGGMVSAGPSSILGTAALQLAASRYCFDRAAQSGDPDLFLQASRLGDASRQSLLAAYELATREAKARQAKQAGGAMPWLEPAKGADR